MGNQATVPSPLVAAKGRVPVLVWLVVPPPNTQSGWLRVRPVMPKNSTMRRASMLA
jgi:hypothetical protein